jgi:hypothetical protein
MSVSFFIGCRASPPEREGYSQITKSVERELWEQGLLSVLLAIGCVSENGDGNGQALIAVYVVVYSDAFNWNDGGSNDPASPLPQ